MFSNYWSYPRYLWNYLMRRIYRKHLENKFYTPIEGYGDRRVVLRILKPGDFLIFMQPTQVRSYSSTLTFPEKVIAYRVYWKDGSKSRWFVPGVNEIGDFHLTHTREVIYQLSE